MCFSLESGWFCIHKFVGSSDNLSWTCYIKGIHSTPPFGIRETAGENLEKCLNDPQARYKPDFENDVQKINPLPWNLSTEKMWIATKCDNAFMVARKRWSMVKFTPRRPRSLWQKLWSRSAAKIAWSPCSLLEAMRLWQSDPITDSTAAPHVCKEKYVKLCFRNLATCWWSDDGSVERMWVLVMMQFESL